MMSGRTREDLLAHFPNLVIGVLGFSSNKNRRIFEASTERIFSQLVENPTSDAMSSHSTPFGEIVSLAVIAQRRKTKEKVAQIKIQNAMVIM